MGINNGDITDDLLGQSNINIYNEIAQNIDCVIHSAAIVKHYGKINEFNDTNVIGTENVIKFCKRFSKKLFYISTLSVSGNKLENCDEKVEFKENQLYIGQDFSNIYVYTKFKAEREILEEIPKGLNACILRIGNVTSRYTDGKFQINISENAFVSRIKSIIALGVIQDKYLNHSLEFTPVDVLAEAIVKVIEHNCEMTVLHLFDNNFIKINSLLEILNKIGIDIKPISDKEFQNNITNVLKNNEQKNKINGIITDLDDNKLLNLVNYVIPNADLSIKYLKLINFEWPDINEEYIKKYIKYLNKIKYI